MLKFELKQKAIALREQGKTYSEIMYEVPVAKSTISLWLREVGLSIAQKQIITEKKRRAQRKGADTQRRKRIERQTKLIENAEIEVKSLSKRELWLIGIALYWAEGAKEKENYPGSRTSFSNSDPKMLGVFIKWLRECIKIPLNDIYIDLYIHESHRNDINDVLKKWSKILKLPASIFKHTYFKKNKVNTLRKNTGVLYLGLLRVNIKTSSDLNRQITGWTKGITESCGILLRS